MQSIAQRHALTGNAGAFLIVVMLKDITDGVIWRQRPETQVRPGPQNTASPFLSDVPNGCLTYLEDGTQMSVYFV